MSVNHGSRLRHLEDRLARVEKQLREQTLAATTREIRATIARRDGVLVLATAVLPIVAGVFIYLVVTTQ